ncbi:hypothetical protein CCP4SC76_7810008 [Gammaproteobacteria bacterium]
MAHQKGSKNAAKDQKIKVANGALVIVSSGEQQNLTRFIWYFKHGLTINLGCLADGMAHGYTATMRAKP